MREQRVFDIKAEGRRCTRQHEPVQYCDGAYEIDTAIAAYEGTAEHLRFVMQLFRHSDQRRIDWRSVAFEEGLSQVGRLRVCHIVDSSTTTLADTS